MVDATNVVNDHCQCVICSCVFGTLHVLGLNWYFRFQHVHLTGVHVVLLLSSCGIPDYLLALETFHYLCEFEVYIA